MSFELIAGQDYTVIGCAVIQQSLLLFHSMVLAPALEMRLAVIV